jgi:uncharacterized DUF497 family protein
LNSGIEFDWDDDNTRHLKRHRVTLSEFEEVVTNDPVYLEYQSETGEERYKAIGSTSAGKILVAIWAPREGKVRAITAYRASRTLQSVYREARGQG